ncbi:hypothetical protein [Nocardia sp. CC201C]|uniref:hypothetical protein n=1 Tax=Nocardia sp. CC201C TaxID=3044575 RepID=UPI0024A98602|nr:hypothetical protein [Nocardia sp. CC201C]
MEQTTTLPGVMANLLIGGACDHPGTAQLRFALRIHGRVGKVRSVLLDDRGYVALMRRYLERAGYTSGPMFRASINGHGRPLSYSAARRRGAPGTRHSPRSTGLLRATVRMDGRTPDRSAVTSRFTDTNSGV